MHLTSRERVPYVSAEKTPSPWRPPPPPLGGTDGRPIPAKSPHHPLPRPYEPGRFKNGFSTAPTARERWSRLPHGSSHHDHPFQPAPPAIHCKYARIVSRLITAPDDRRIVSSSSPAVPSTTAPLRSSKTDGGIHRPPNARSRRRPEGRRTHCTSSLVLKGLGSLRWRRVRRGVAATATARGHSSTTSPREYGGGMVLYAKQTSPPSPPNIKSAEGE